MAEKFAMTFEVPTWPQEISRRDFNAFAKEALEEAAIFHHRKHIPLHFRPDAKTRYGYAKRTEKYIKRKQRTKGHSTDLVWSGRSRTSIVRARIQRGSGGNLRLGGSAAGNNLSATMILSFDFRKPGHKAIRDKRRRVGFVAFKIHYRAGVTIPDMVREVQVMTADEVAAIRGKFRDEFIRRMEKRMATKQRKRLRTVSR